MGDHRVEDVVCQKGGDSRHALAGERLAADAVISRGGQGQDIGTVVIRNVQKDPVLFKGKADLQAFSVVFGGGKHADTR